MHLRVPVLVLDPSLLRSMPPPFLRRVRMVRLESRHANCHGLYGNADENCSVAHAFLSDQVHTSCSSSSSLHALLIPVAHVCMPTPLHANPSACPSPVAAG